MAEAVKASIIVRFRSVTSAAELPPESSLDRPKGDHGRAMRRGHRFAVDAVLTGEPLDHQPSSERMNVRMTPFAVSAT